MTVYRYGRPVTVATLGLLRSDSPLTVGTDGILEPLQVVVDADLLFGGSADIYFDLQYAVVERDLVFNGEATAAIAITYTADGGIVLNGTATANFDFIFEYDTAGGVLFNGAADAAATVAITYDASGGIVLNGDSIEAFIEPVHVADGGIIFNGEATVVPVGFQAERGGKGVPRRRRFLETPHIWTYTSGYEPVGTSFLVEIGKRRTDQLLSFGGESIARFVPPKYLLIPTLPSVPKPLVSEPSEFLQLYFDVARTHIAPRFSYVSSGGAIKMDGQSSVGYLDYGDVIITADDEMMLLGMLDDMDPTVIATRFDSRMQRIKNEEEELIQLGLL